MAVLEDRRKSDMNLRQHFVTVALFLAVQTFTAIWWASGVNTSLGFITKQVITMGDSMAHSAENRYLRDDATRDFDVLTKRFDRNETRISRLEDVLRGKVN